MIPRVDCNINESKLTRRSRKTATKKSQSSTSIVNKHEEMMEKFKNKDVIIKDINSKINLLVKESEHLKKEIALMSINSKYKDTSNLHVKIEKCKATITSYKQELNDLLTGKTETDYILNVCTIVNKYLMLEEQEQNLLNNQASSGNNMEQIFYEINVKKKLAADEYMMKIDPTYVSNCNLNTKEGIICDKCDSPDAMKFEDGFAVCYTCGSCFDSVHQAEDCSYKEMQEMDYRTQFTYQKSTHLDDWIRRFQAKEHKGIPQEILDKVILEAKKERVTNLNTLTEDKVKKYLKKLDLNEYYDNVIQIINRINKRPPFVLTQEIEYKIKEMFQKIQEPFERHKDPKRKNMLSYSYLLHKFFLILDLQEFSKYFFLLKSQDKLRQQDETFKKIVDELAVTDPSTKWLFFPSC